MIRDADAVVEKVMFCARPDRLDPRAAKGRFIDLSSFRHWKYSTPAWLLER